jgi:hypothetical protein
MNSLKKSSSVKQCNADPPHGSLEFCRRLKKAVYAGFTIHGWVGMVAAGIAALRLVPDWRRLNI